jgi:hypothetical protein
VLLPGVPLHVLLEDHAPVRRRRRRRRHGSCSMHDASICLCFAADDFSDR